MSLLIIDDSQEERLLLKTILEHRGYGNLFMAASFREARNYLKSHDLDTSDEKINLILLDIVMPEMDGIEMLRRIKTEDRFRDIPIIMVTGKNDLKNLEMAFSLGAVDYVSKPYNKIELMARISSALRLKREMDQRKMHECDLEKKNKELEKALNEVKVLRGFIPICAACKKIRDDKGFWQQVECYISKHSSAQFTHGICPDCMVRLYPEVKEAKRQDGGT
ncbi:MAG: response regulator [Candidatus Omnitrophica bacterium]|nr:response regulator [Candidatus Omnitrophota bacterium]